MIVVDEAHETSFKQEDGVHYHARDVAVMRGRFEGCPVVLASATPAIETRASGRARPLPRIEAARALRRGRDAGDRGDRPAGRTAAARALDRAAAGERDRRDAGARRAGAAVPQPPRLCAADAVPALRAPFPMPQLHRVDGRAPADPPPVVPPLRPHVPDAQRLSRMQGRGQPGRVRPRRRAHRRRGHRALSGSEGRDRHQRHDLVARPGPPSSSRGWRRTTSTSSSARNW